MHQMEALSTWDGSLSLDDFYVAAKTLSQRWKEVDPSSSSSWTWIRCQRLPYGDSYKADGYFSLEKVHLLKSSEESQVEHCCFAEEESLEAATLVKSYNPDIHIYDFHIVYNSSYRVPVLYFRGYQCDGQLLQLDVVKEDLPLCSSRLLMESKWTFITWEEHPYLKRPWFTLHPCGTSDWMKILFHGSTFMTKDSVVQQYMLSWLSVVGQAVGLKVPLQIVSISDS